MMKNYEIKDRFIAGNVVAKVEWIENYLKDYPDDDASKKSLEALQKAIPEPISFELLDFNLEKGGYPYPYMKSLPVIFLRQKPISTIRNPSTSSV